MGGVCIVWQVERYKGKPNYRLMSIMKEQGFTDEELAKAAGISEKTVQALRLGRHWPRLDSILLICNALNCSVDTLYPMDL